MTFASRNAQKNFVLYFAQLKYINGKGRECRLAMKAAMNAAAVESDVHIKILNGNIQKADMGLFSDSLKSFLL